MYAQKVYGQLSLFGAEKSVDKNEYSQKMNNYSSELAKQTEQTSKVISFADHFLPHTNTDVKPQIENKITKHTNKERSSKVFALRTQEEIYAMLREFNLAISNAKSPKKLKIAHRNKLVFVFCFSHDHTIDFVVDVDFFQESLADMVKQLVKVAVIVVYVADIRSMVTLSILLMNVYSTHRKLSTLLTMTE